MISVVIPAANAAAHLSPTLESLVAAAVEGTVGEVIIANADGDSETARIAEAWGARIVDCERGRGRALRAGAEVARKPWLLFLHADTKLAPGWDAEAERFMLRGAGQAAAFRFMLADEGIWPRLLEAGVALRCRLFALPYGDQGLLISRKLYDELGGYKPIPIMEDVDIVRRIGRKRLTLLRSAALTSALRYRRDGYLRRITRNFVCLAMHAAGVAPEKISAFYERPGKKAPSR
jgi:rSAM/selenodomain-associated transferase 2